MSPRFRPIDFHRVADEAARYAHAIVPSWLPNGRREGREWIALNPRRPADSHLGSFKINLTTGAWGDFATGDRGGDLISLAGYLFGLNQREAAENVAKMIGCDPYE